MGKLELSDFALFWDTYSRSDIEQPWTVARKGATVGTKALPSGGPVGQNKPINMSGQVNAPVTAICVVIAMTQMLYSTD